MTIPSPLWKVIGNLRAEGVSKVKVLKRKVKFVQDTVDVTCVTLFDCWRCMLYRNVLVYFFIDDFQLFSFQVHLRVKM